MAMIKYPYTNLHELNLDWIIEQLGKDGPVLSVNEKTGVVTLTAEDIKRTATGPQTVEYALSTQGNSIQEMRTEIGIVPLPTVAQTLTGAIAENAQEIADVEDNVIGNTALPTVAQTLTGAIAENAQEIADVEDNVIGNTTLPTVAQTLTGAIAENAQNLTNSIADVNNKKANIAKGTVAGPGSETITPTFPCLVAIGRATSSTTPTIALIDSWGSAIYISNNENFTISSSIVPSYSLTIGNNTSSYASYVVMW